MQAAFGQVLHTWRDDMYASVISLLPPGPADPANPADPSAAGAGPAPGQWAAVLRESLRGGVSAPLLAADAVTFGERLEQAVWSRTRGYNAGDVGHYPASPRALAHLQVAQVTAFFGAALLGAADTVLRDHDRKLIEHRRRANVVIDLLSEVAKSLDFTSPVQVLSRIAVGLTVEVIEAKARQAVHNLPTGAPRAVLDDLSAGLRIAPDWQTAYRSSAHDVWARRRDDPIRPVRVQRDGGGTRLYTGDPRTDGFITGPRDDFLGPSGEPLAPEEMSGPQRAAYVAWLASPALVANNDRVPVPVATLPSEAAPGWAPDWARGGGP
jgi:hypothetical protein